MPDSRFVLFTVDVRNPERTQEDIEQFTRYLVSEFEEIDGVEQVSLVRDNEIPEHAKSVGGFIAGLLTSKITLEGANTALSLLKDAVGGKPIEIEVTAETGQSLKVKAANLKDLEKGIELVKKAILG